MTEQFDPGQAWIPETNSFLQSRQIMPPPNEEYIDHVTPDGKISRWVKKPDHPLWTVLATRGGIDLPNNYAIKTPFGWVGIHYYDDQKPTAGFNAPGWRPPESYSILLNEGRNG